MSKAQESEARFLREQLKHERGLADVYAKTVMQQKKEIMVLQGLVCLFGLLIIVLLVKVAN